MNGFKPMPTAYLAYDGIDYSNAMPLQREITFECQYVSPVAIEIGGHQLDCDTALKVYEFLQASGEDGPIRGLSRDIKFFPDDFSSPAPGGVVEEVTTWLGYALGLQEWTGSYDEWEF